MSRDLPELLFHEYDLSQTLESGLNKARETVDAIPEDQFLNTDDDTLLEHVYSRFEVIPIELYEDRMEMDPQETQVDVSHDFLRGNFDHNGPCSVPGILVKVTVPFAGDPFLWKCKPNPYTRNPPRANVITSPKGESGYIEILATRPTDVAVDGSELKRQIDDILRNVKDYLENIRKNVESHNQRQKNHIRQCIANRRQRLGKHAEVVKAINIPLKKKPGAPDISALPIKRKLVRPLPAAPNKPPEPGIRDEDYEHILKVIRHEGRSFETNPGTFAKHGEEELRDIIRAHLNGHYEGQATAETFRVSGKTDICIEDSNRAAFVAECKIWHGNTELLKALDQLLGYLTWRDCKAALIIFNTKNAGFSEIQSNMHGIIQGHTKFIKNLDVSEPGEWRFLLRSKSDEEREVILHVFLFNLFVKT